MGKNSNVMNRYFSDNRRFADLFNAVFFQGLPVVKEEELSEASEVYHQPEIERPGTGGRGKLIERIHDVCKKLENGEILRILTLENQSQVDYAMPFRCLQYDTMEYGKQIDAIRRKNERECRLCTAPERLSGLLKSDRLTPVFTLCLYHGEEKWDGPRSLHDMMQFAGVEDRFRKFFNDYPLRLYCLNEAENLELFQTEVGQLFRVLQYRGDRAGLKRLLENDPQYRHLDKDTFEAMTVLLKLSAVWKKQSDILCVNGDKEEYNMCQAVIEWEAAARSEGEKIKLIKLICQKLQKGKTPEVIAEELEEPMESVGQICQAVFKCGLETDALEIYEHAQSSETVM